MRLRKMKSVAFLAATILVMATAATAAQESSDRAKGDQQKTQPPAASEPQDNPTAGLKTRVFEIKYGNPRDIAGVIGPLSSDNAWARIAVSKEYHTITVRDFPENIATIEEAIKRLDQPTSSPQPKLLEFHVHILLAADAAPGKSPAEDYPPEAAAAIKELRTTLKYKSYNVVASSVQRCALGDGADNRGVIVAHEPDEMPYSYSIFPMSMESSGGRDSIFIRQFKFQLTLPAGRGHGSETVGFGSPLTIKEGEEVVVGTTTIGEGAVVVLLIAKILH